LLIPSGELHTLTSPATGSRFIFMIDISFLSSIKSFSSIQSLLVQPIHLTPKTHPAIYDEIYSLLMNMQVEFFQEREYSELTIYSLLIDLFVKLGYDYLYGQELFPSVRLPKQKEYIRKFQQLLAYIDEHYMEDLDLDKLSASIDFSKFHFLRLFKQYMGATLGDYVTLRRIKAAEQLLCNQSIPIAEVATLSGFSSISTFNRLFKQYKNCSPSEYRQHHIVH
ncbi:MAG: helix-turn-helix transcriptional regulator, partial [Lachnospiraceae bacterium]|nr:helix-turn-helix transcriptional regulator [Lachnospiraceae bacterium]